MLVLKCVFSKSKTNFEKEKPEKVLQVINGEQFVQCSSCGIFEFFSGFFLECCSHCVSQDTTSSWSLQASSQQNGTVERNKTNIDKKKQSSFIFTKIENIFVGKSKNLSMLLTSSRFLVIIFLRNRTLKKRFILTMYLRYIYVDQFSI